MKGGVIASPRASPLVFAREKSRRRGRLSGEHDRVTGGVVACQGTDSDLNTRRPARAAGPAETKLADACFQRGRL